MKKELIKPNRKQLREAWNKGMLNQLPSSPGFYWLFLNRWRLVRVYKNGYGELCTKISNRIQHICAERWGKEFV